MDPHKVPHVIQYCSQYWVSHLTEAASKLFKTGDNKRILDFLHEYLLHWVETLAIIGRIDDAVNGLANLKILASSLEQSDLESFVKDAHRFILYHRPTIEEAPLQVYYMAAIFTPTNSLMKKEFSSHFPAWLRKSPIMERDWDSQEQSFASDGHIHTVAVSNDEKLAAAFTKYGIHVWNLVTGKLEHVMNQRSFSQAGNYLRFSPAGTELALGGPLIKVRDIENDKEHDIRCFATCPSHGQILWSTFTQRRWNKGSFEHSAPKGYIHILDLVKEDVASLSKYGTYWKLDSSHGLVFQGISHQMDGEKDGIEWKGKQGLWIWSLMTEIPHLTKGTVVPTSLGRWDTVAVAVSSSGTRIAIIDKFGGRDPSTLESHHIKYCELLIEIWELCEDSTPWHLHQTARHATNFGIALINSNMTPSLGAEFSADGTRVMICSRHLNIDDPDLPTSWTGSVIVWCVETGEIELETYLSEELLCATLSHHSKMLAIGFDTGVDVLENNRGQTKKLSFKHDGRPACIAFSTQDTRIAVGWDVGEVSIRVISTGETQWILKGRPFLVRHLQFSSDDSWVEEPFYTLDGSGEWILHDNKKILALPRKFQGDNSESNFTDLREDYKGNTIAFVFKELHLVAFMFNGIPNL
ncbi:uncharacterized protein N7483_011319 [Penicillium malachiteum]|uniref:uncharacterized protein n=1 Tax=Penicillium malachiteum TaxID=1324776 RepID=UPI002548703D|nr:uncharacterized protein N7483_011319 [Penicillium malachiteum]KAJ5714138.1 hypothetical protein N7483_011319 [Penicillium malachiteum]